MSPPTVPSPIMLPGSALKQPITPKEPEAPQPQVNKYLAHQLASTMSPPTAHSATMLSGSALSQSVAPGQPEAPQLQVNNDHPLPPYPSLPKELQALIQSYVVASENDQRIEATSFVVSREYMWNATHAWDVHFDRSQKDVKFLFNSENFCLGKVSTRTRLFAECMGHLVHCLVFSTRDTAITNLPGALEELLELFPSVKEVRLVDVTRRRLGFGRQIPHATGRPTMMRDLARSESGVSWDQVMNWYHYDHPSPFEWLQPILKRMRYRTPPLPSNGRITKFSIEWFDGEERKNSLKWGGAGNPFQTDITNVFPTIINLYLARHHRLSDAELQQLRWSTDAVSEESVYRLGELVRARLDEDEIEDEGEWDELRQECLLLEEDLEYDAAKEHSAVREILDDIWKLKQIETDSE